MEPRFLQLHTLTAYPAALLNRDDAGFAKRLPFGAATRTRVSSQCLKRHWRRFTGPHGLGTLGLPMSIRSRHTLEAKLVAPLIEEDGVDKALARAVVDHLAVTVFGESAKAKAKRSEKAKQEENQAEDEPLETGQITVLGEPELAFLREQAKAIAATCADAKKVKEAAKQVLGKDGLANLKTMAMAAGLDAALFGRMVTSDILARCDAAIHVAHAFTVHREQREDDYFTAVDELDFEAQRLGAGHVNATELTSGLYYGYVVVDVALLVSNLTGCTASAWQRADRSLAGQVVEHLVHLVATVSPGAKLGSTAPHALAHALIAECGSGQPSTLANAFIEPVSTGGDLIADTYAALAQELYDIDSNYPSNRGQRAHMARGRDERYACLNAIEKGAQRVVVDLGERLDLDRLAVWAGAHVAGTGA